MGAYHGAKKIGEMTEANLKTALAKDQGVVFYCSGFT